jgi:transposase
LIYVDESDIHLNPQLTKVWMVRGERVRVPAAGINRKVHVFGSLNYRTGRTTHIVRSRKRGVEFCEFLRHLFGRYRGKRLVLAMDNASYHKTKAVAELLSEHSDRVEPFWLPTYSPELNYVDGLWGYVKKTALNNHFFGDVGSLEHAIHSTFRALNRKTRSPLDMSFTLKKDLRKSA